MNEKLCRINQKLMRSALQVQRLFSTLVSPQSSTFRPKKLIHKKISNNPEEDYQNKYQTYHQQSTPSKNNSNVQTNVSSKIREPKNIFMNLKNSKAHFQQQTPRKNSLKYNSTHYNLKRQQSSFEGCSNQKISSPHISGNFANKIITKTNTTILKTRNNLHRNITQIDYKQVINHAFSRQPLTTASKPEDIFDYFSIYSTFFKKPLIKKFKNCVYFGQIPQPTKKNKEYSGFIYFYSSKIYYGTFLQQHKNGLGTQINLNNLIVYKGTFNRGHKIGKFKVYCRDISYEGYLHKGRFHGYGKLQTPISKYEGQFFNGMRHGKGQEYFHQNGLKLSGLFQNNKFSNNNNIHYAYKNLRLNKSANKFRNKNQVNNIFEYSFHDQQSDYQSIEGKDNKIKWHKFQKHKLSHLQNTKQELIEQQSSDDDDPLPSHFMKRITKDCK